MMVAIGRVVDDSIVVLENISRHVSEGERPLVAAYTGAREITTAGGALVLQSNSVSGVGGVSLQGAGVTRTGGTISTDESPVNGA